MGQIAAAVVVLAGAVARRVRVSREDSLTVSGIAGLLLLIVGGVLYLAETARAGGGRDRRRWEQHPIQAAGAMPTALREAVRELG